MMHIMMPIITFFISFIVLMFFSVGHERLVFKKIKEVRQLAIGI